MESLINVENLTNQQLTDFIKQGKGLVLDVRTVAEYEQLGHIPEAVNIPIHELPARVGELDKQKPIAVICEHGVRSFDAAHWLVHQGFKTVYNHERGMAEWDGRREFS